MSGRDGEQLIVCGKCGGKFMPRDWQIASRDRRCLPCKRAQQNAANLAKGAALREEAKASYRRRAEYYKDYAQKARNDPAHLQKRAARRKVATEIEAGRLCRGKCESCGAENADAHHEDYSAPLLIQWLCRRCHFRIDGHGRKRADAMLAERAK